MGYRDNMRGKVRGDRACAVLAIFAALVMISTFGARSAFADVDWHEKGANMSATVGPWSYPEGREYALAEFLGYDWSSLSTQVRDSILTDSNGDNQFTQLLNHNVINVQYETQDGVLDWPIISIWSTVFGLDKLWDISTTNERYVAAQNVMKKYMFPNEGETPSTPDVEGIQFYTLDKIANMPTSTRRNYTSATISTTNATVNGQEYPKISLSSLSGNETYTYGDTIQVAIDPYMIEKLKYERRNNNLDKYFIAFGDDFIRVYGYNSTNVTMTVVSNGLKFKKIAGERYSTDIAYCGAGTTRMINGIVYPYSSSYSTNGYGLDTGDSNTQKVNYYLEVNDFTGGGGGGGEPYVPTPDPTPTPPSITIGDVTIDLSNGPVTYNNVTYSVVYAPDDSWSVNVEVHNDNQYGGDVTASDSTDYTSILNAILAAINAFRDEVNSFNNQINANITTAINSINTSLHSIDTSLGNKILNVKDQLHNDIQTLQANIQDTIKKRWDTFSDDLWANMAALDGDIIEELDAVARYLVESMDFGDTFSDKNIITWLKKIYIRLGSQPVIKNPTEDPVGWFDDLKSLLEMILDTALAGVDTAALASLWNTAKSHFPLSLPWDMLAIVGLLAHEPVTPAVEYPIVYNGTTLAEIEFDLSDYEDVADISRKMSVIVFAMGLLITYPQIFHTLEPLTKALRG